MEGSFFFLGLSSVAKAVLLLTRLAQLPLEPVTTKPDGEGGRLYGSSTEVAVGMVGDDSLEAWGGGEKRGFHFTTTQ